MSREKLFHVGVKALIENQRGDIILLKAPGWPKNNIPPHWDIPGGRIQEGQTVLEVLSREIEEETGITEIAEPKFFTAVISNHEIPLEGKSLGLVMMVYKVKIPEDAEVALSEEHTAYEWVDKKEAARRLADKYPSEFTNLL